MYAALGIFGVVLSTLFLPLPEELALLGAGYLAHSGALPLWAAWLSSWAGIVVGDTSSYLLGRSFLPRLLRSRFGKRIVSPDLREWAEGLVERHGFRAILLGRFLVALRGPVYLAIGAAKYPMAKFEAINGAVGLVEVAILVGLGYVFGRSTRVEHRAVWLEIAVAVAMGLILLVPPIVKWRMVKRRRTTGRLPGRGVA
jgi:membrane-associated protein